MRRRRLPDSERISLFPFLAVLICTMGALLVLLVVIAQRAQAKAQAQEEVQTAERVRAHRTQVGQLRQLQQQLSNLQRLRDETAGRLAERRALLAHSQDHTRRLRAELAAVQESFQRLDESGSEGTSRLQDMRDKLDRVNAQITESQQLLAETQTGLENRHPSYAVVPYEGQHGTRRRPIYLDCREDAIVLQPEGITLTEHDFRAPLGPDNPLASVLRVSSEYLNTSQGGEQGRPYPLLLVRPAGIRAYYAARAALKSWDAEFGYELIGDDWEIEYPAADPQLAQVASQELILARKRHEMYLVRHRSGSGGSGRGGSGSGGGPGSGYRGEGQGEESPAAGGGFGGSADDGGPAAAGTAAANGGMSPAAEGTLTGPSPQGPATASQGQTSAGDFDSAAASAAAGGQSAVSVADQNLAETRGRDWALPDASRDAVPFSRPIRIEVHANQIMIVPRDANDKLQVIAAQGPTQEVIEEFVSAVWGHMKGWGIAGRGMYWKPILNVYVAAGGDRRAAEMEILLEGSGLEVNRLDR